MQVPETPKRVSDLDLMQRLAHYAAGEASWDPMAKVGEEGRNSCNMLHVNLTLLVEKAIAQILDRTTSREMDTFTMHDRAHGLKVAHLMWQVLDPSRRQRLTPPEIALLVLAAYFHDVGMALTKEERLERLGPSSDLWEKLDIQDGTKARMEKLRAEIGSPDVAIGRQAKSELDQMEEALLSQDTRERHATHDRYNKVLGTLREFHHANPENIPGIDECLSFDGNSFRDKLVDICVSHNEDADAIVRRDSENPGRSRFPANFPIGFCTADLHMVAAALRLADILDFDRERTPPVLFYYLVPSDLPAKENRAALEWEKHMSISHWHVDEDAIVFRGRCKDHIVHHAIVLFCAAIQEEIHSTRATFGALNEQAPWPFKLPGVVKSEIHEEGYHYVPYRFELDDQRIYSLLMGGAIYEDPMVAVRELLQNAVDACKLRDALTQRYEPYAPITTNRIFSKIRRAKSNSRVALTGRV
jgi:molecular chaperone HtpG